MHYLISAHRHESHTSPAGPGLAVGGAHLLPWSSDTSILSAARYQSIQSTNMAAFFG